MNKLSFIMGVLLSAVCFPPALGEEAAVSKISAIRDIEAMERSVETIGEIIAVSIEKIIGEEHAPAMRLANIRLVKEEDLSPDARENELLMASLKKNGEVVSLFFSQGNESVCHIVYYCDVKTGKLLFVSGYTGKLLFVSGYTGRPVSFVIQPLN